MSGGAKPKIKLNVGFSIMGEKVFFFSDFLGFSVRREKASLFVKIFGFSAKNGKAFQFGNYFFWGGLFFKVQKSLPF